MVDKGFFILSTLNEFEEKLFILSFLGCILYGILGFFLDYIFGYRDGYHQIIARIIDFIIFISIIIIIHLNTSIL